MNIKLWPMLTDKYIYTYTYKTYLTFHFCLKSSVCLSYFWFLCDRNLGVLICFTFFSCQVKKSLKLDRSQWGNSPTMPTMQTEVDRSVWWRLLLGWGNTYTAKGPSWSTQDWHGAVQGLTRPFLESWRLLNYFLI